MAGSEDATSTNEEDTPLELTKPVELERVGPAAGGLFDMLGRWFDSGAVLTADISSIHTDAVAAELRGPQMVARFTMRRLQTLNLIALPGTRTTTDVVVVQIDSILRALLETPSRHLRSASEDVDWDHEWAVLDAGMLLASECPEQEAQLFQAHCDGRSARRRHLPAPRGWPEDPRLLAGVPTSGTMERRRWITTQEKTRARSLGHPVR